MCKTKLPMLLFALLACALAACGTRRQFSAPDIDPPADLIPTYIPKGYKLISGFQITGQDMFPSTIWGDNTLSGRLGEGNAFFDLKSPAGNVIQGVYYQGKDHLILISKSYFPDGSLDLWRAHFEASNHLFGECECVRLRPSPGLFPSRFLEIQEERTIGEAQVVIVKGPIGWTTVFVRGEYLLTVESSISLEENLKIVISLLGKQ